MTLARDLANLARTTTTTAELNKLDGFTGTTAELNKLSGFTGVAADLNYAKDLKATGVTTTEFDYLDGLTDSLAITDFSSSVTIDSQFLRVTTDLENPPIVALQFGPLAFIYGGIRTAGATPSNNSTLFTVPSAYKPHRYVLAPTSSHEGDTAQYLYMQASDGAVKVRYPVNEGHANWNVVFNFWYKIA